MEWLNYQHLLYFWTTARLGGVSRAAEELHLSQPTISSQLRLLERSFGRKLFARRGRNLALTEPGRVVFRYAEDIFALGRELSSTMRGDPDDRMRGTLSIGVASTLSKSAAGCLLEPALKLAERFRISVRTDKMERLSVDLAAHQFDVVLADSSMTQVGMRLHHHLLGECKIQILGGRPLAQRYRDDFPRSLDGAPMLLPIGNVPLRRALDEWFAVSRIYPRITAEIEDMGVLEAAAEAGHGVFATPAVGAAEVCRSPNVVEIGELTDVSQRIYLISSERQRQHPAITAIVDGAQQRIFVSTGNGR
jgi:LysR family transcriptional activator of nhaA